MHFLRFDAAHRKGRGNLSELYSSISIGAFCFRGQVFDGIVRREKKKKGETDERRKGGRVRVRNSKFYGDNLNGTHFNQYT